MDGSVPFDEVVLLKEMEEDYLKPFPLKIKKDGRKYFMKIIPILNEMERVKQHHDLTNYKSCNEFSIHKKIIDELNLIHVPNIILSECSLIPNNEVKVMKKGPKKKLISKTLMSIKKDLIEYSKHDTQEYSLIYVTEWINDSVDIDTLSDIVSSLSVSDKVKDGIWKNVVFQVFYTLYILQKKFKFMHNDLHTNNILVDECPPGGYIKYTVEDIDFYVPNIGYIIKIADFEWSTTEETNHLNSYYESSFNIYSKKIDVFLFVSCLTDCELSKELTEMIYNAYGIDIFNDCNDNIEPYFCKQRLTSKGHSHYEEILKTPYQLLMSSYFDEYKTIKHINPHA